MKILLSSLSLHSEHGTGTAQRTRFLARYLSRSGAECSVATIEDGDLARELRDAGIPVYATGHIRAPYHIPFIDFRRLSRLVAEADAVHILGYWNLLSVSVAWLARKHGRPYVLSGAGEFAALDQRSVVKRMFHRLFGERMIDGAVAIVAITGLEKCQISARLAIAPDRILVLPNGVEISDPAPSHRRNEESGAILFMGRLATIKGPDLLLEAFANVADRFPDVRLVLAGPDGGMLAGLKRRCEALRLSQRVSFPGFMGEAARDAAYADALLVAVPSRDEAMSLVALEAGAHAKPVLITDRCGLDDIEGLGAGRVAPATVEGLTVALGQLLSEREKLGAAGANMRAYVAAHYSWPEIARLLVQFLGDHMPPARVDTTVDGAQ